MLYAFSYYNIINRLLPYRNYLLFCYVQKMFPSSYELLLYFNDEFTRDVSTEMLRGLMPEGDFSPFVDALRNMMI